VSAAAAIFTPQDLSAQAAKVFDAVRRFGSAQIRTSDGETFEMKIKPEEKLASSVEFPNFEARWQRMSEMGFVPPPSSEMGRINQIIAGEV
jgi:hypothetical protein